MKDRIAILIPSRGRPERLYEAVQSVFNTSRIADVYVYIDKDEREIYEAAKPKISGLGTFKMLYGPRYGPVGSAWVLCQCAMENRDKYMAIGLFVDDCKFVTPGWDEAIAYEAERLGPIWAMSPAHSQGAFMDFAIVSQQWVDNLGWIAYPALYHFGWPSIVEALAEATTLVRLPKEVMFVEHDRMEPYDVDKAKNDPRQIHSFFVTNQYARSLETLRLGKPVEQPA